MSDDEIKPLITEEIPSPPDDTQPFANVPERSRRHWVPAEWSAPGEGEGHPKLSGGYEADNRTGAVVPRSLNRLDQRYALDADTLQARRTERALSEYASSVVLVGAGSLFEVRPPSGNQYDVTSDVSKCDCPDWYRLQESGRPTVQCKHQQIVAMALADPDLPNGPGWSAGKVAEYASISVDIVRRACALGLIPASKVHGVWDIAPSGGDTIKTLYTYVTPAILSLSPDTEDAGSGSTPVTIEGTGFCAFSRIVWDAATVISTVLVSPTELTGTLPSILLSTPGVHNLRVENAFPGGSTSEPHTFTLT